MNQLFVLGKLFRFFMRIVFFDVVFALFYRVFSVFLWIQQIAMQWFSSVKSVAVGQKNFFMSDKICIFAICII
jgi:hypothetical protein